MTAIDAVSLMAVVIVIGRRPSLWSRFRAWVYDDDHELRLLGVVLAIEAVMLSIGIVAIYLSTLH